MKLPGRYYVYLTTNQHKTVLYTGITNDLDVRAAQHKQDALFTGNHFTGKYQAFYVVYFEVYHDVNKAIAREKEIKGWSRKKKLMLIKEGNPDMQFLNDSLLASGISED